jgi:hypothetical protein
MSEVKVNKISPRTNCGTVTLGDSGDTFSIPAGVTLTNSGTATGFGPTGAVSWNTTKITADPNPAVSGVGYFADTTSSAFTVTLPAAPSAGDIVALSDYTGTFTTNNLTVGRNGSNIRGSATDLILNVNNQTITLIYVDATEGWNVIQESNNINNFVAATGGTVLTCGDFKTHVFTGPGTFTVTSAGNSLGSSTVEYLVIAGGGSGGNGDVGAGGGAGGYRQNYPSPAVAGLPVTTQGYPITVGGGGSGVPGYVKGNCGTNSTFSTIISTGGGGGGGGPGAPGNPLAPGKTGGSGGGGAWNGGTGGAGNTPPTSPSQGNNGGSQSGGPPLFATGGGGGAGGAGTNGGSSTIGNGGIGSPIATTFFGPTAPSYGTPGPAPGRYFAGGASGISDGGTSGTAGAGGGATKGANGSTNTGGGGGAQLVEAGNSGTGGSGIVVIRYKFQ